MDAINPAQIIIQQYNALFDLYNSTNGGNWTWKLPYHIYGHPWNFSDHLTFPCDLSGKLTWQGLLCEEDGYKLTGITLVYNNNLNGTLPASIGNLTYVRDLFLENNYIHGTMPNTMANLQDLYAINVDFNYFTGPIPYALYQLPNIYYISAVANFISGSLPTNLSSTLQVVVFPFNLLTGTIPDIWGLHHFDSIQLYSNHLMGTLPANVSGWNNLTQLYLGDNHFTGSLASLVADNNEYKLLRYFYTDTNSFTGEIPELLLLHSPLLNRLTFNDNFFTGKLSLTQEDTPTLSELYLQNNLFTGQLPAFLDTIGILNCSSNYFSLSLPERSTSSNTVNPYPSLSIVDLSNNYITGRIHEFFAIYPLLSYLTLDNNFFSGNLHNAFNCTNQRILYSISVGFNQFTGTLPFAIFHEYSVLTQFIASVNCFTGKLPEEICDNNILFTLVLDGLHSSSHCVDRILNIQSPGTYLLSTSLAGTIPKCIFNMSNLNTFHLSGNDLLTTLPNHLDISESLVNLVLNHNRISGNISESIYKKAWQTLDLSYNRFGGVLSEDIYNYSANPSTSLNLQQNWISGNIPEQLYEAKNINILQGNIFACNLDGSGLPVNDPLYASYVCGSDDVNIALYAWSAAFGISALVLVYYWKYCHEVYYKWMAIYSSPIAGIFYNLPIDHLYDYGQQLQSLKRMIYLIVFFCIVILSPMYIVVTVYYATYDYLYGWTVALCYFTGTNPAIIVFMFLIALLAILESFFLDQFRRLARTKLAQKKLLNDSNHNSSNHSNGSRSLRLHHLQQLQQLPYPVKQNQNNQQQQQLRREEARGDDREENKDDNHDNKNSNNNNDNNNNNNNNDIDNNNEEDDSNSNSGSNSPYSSYQITSRLTLGGAGRGGSSLSPRRGADDGEDQGNEDTSSPLHALPSVIQPVNITSAYSPRRPTTVADYDEEQTMNVDDRDKVVDGQVEKTQGDDDQIKKEQGETKLDEDHIKFNNNHNNNHSNNNNISRKSYLLPPYLVFPSSTPSSSLPPSLTPVPGSSADSLSAAETADSLSPGPPSYTASSFSLRTILQSLSQPLTPRTKANIMKKTALVTLVAFLASVLVVGVNGTYVYSLTTKLTLTSSFLITIAVSVFKYVWNTHIVIEGIGRHFSLWMLHQGFISKIESLLPFQLSIGLFGNIIAPYVAEAVMSEDCFYNAIFPAQAVTTTFRSFSFVPQAVFFYPQYIIQGVIFYFDQVPRKTNRVLSYNPPFLYSYECTSSLLTSYSYVFVYRYLLSGFFLPLFWLIAKYWQEEIYRHVKGNKQDWRFKCCTMLLPYLLKPVSEVIVYPPPPSTITAATGNSSNQPRDVQQPEELEEGTRKTTTSMNRMMKGGSGSASTSMLRKTAMRMIEEEEEGEEEVSVVGDEEGGQTRQQGNGKGKAEKEETTKESQQISTSTKQQTKGIVPLLSFSTLPNNHNSNKNNSSNNHTTTTTTNNLNIASTTNNYNNTNSLNINNNNTLNNTTTNNSASTNAKPSSFTQSMYNNYSPRSLFFPSSLTPRTASQQAIRDRNEVLFTKRNHVVKFVTDFAVLMTFGVLFPPLSVPIGFSMLVDMAMLQMMIGRLVLLAKMQPYREELTALVEIINQEFADFFLMIAPFFGFNVTVLAAIFWSYALYETLSLQEGASTASWIFVGTATAPIWLSWLNRLNNYCFHKTSQPVVEMGIMMRNRATTLVSGASNTMYRRTTGGTVRGSKTTAAATAATGVKKSASSITFQTDNNENEQQQQQQQEQKGTEANDEAAVINPMTLTTHTAPPVLDEHQKQTTNPRSSQSASSRLRATLSAVVAAGPPSSGTSAGNGTGRFSIFGRTSLSHSTANHSQSHSHSHSHKMNTSEGGGDGEDDEETGLEL